MERILELCKTYKKTIIGVLIVVLGYLGYDDIAEQVKSFAGEPTELITTDTTIVTYDTIGLEDPVTGEWVEQVTMTETDTTIVK